MIMQYIRQLTAECPLPTLSELRLCECCWVEATDKPRLPLLGKQPLGSMVYLSPLPWEDVERTRQEWEKFKKARETPGLRREGSQHQHHVPPREMSELWWLTATSVDSLLRKGWNCLPADPEGLQKCNTRKKRCQILKSFLVKKTSICIDLEFKSWYYFDWI